MSLPGKILLSLIFITLAVEMVPGAPRIVQSRLVSFPISGQAIVQAIEEFDQNPSLIIKSKKTGKILLTHTISAAEDELKPKRDQSPSFNAFLRFEIISADCFKAPLILAIAVAPGGSDHGFWSTVIGESEGKIATLTPVDIQNHVQGGLFLGRLNKRFGCGLAIWNFIWDDGAHYDQHPYEIEIYSWQKNRLVRQLKYRTKHKYDGNGAAALRELEIQANDQRIKIAKVKKYIS